ncbi:MAG: polysaccharide biosynthesis/export family protein [Flavobacteriales bacterium]|nr:polysaccharide biosynthesis/export family protein [Flavobacteriales bacterium]MDW8409097.1 polysaccharide biosynthesis/export family protein [Flavobacteriales bacterium]
MIRTPKNYKYDEFPAVRDSQYVIGINDELSILLVADGGFPLIDIVGANLELTRQFNEARRQGTQVVFTVEYDGTIKLPLVGRLKVQGMYVRQLEDTLERIFSKHYRDPYVQVKVLNQRVIVFPGQGGSAKVVRFENPNMTLFEAIASSGGLSRGAKAYRIKLIRGDLKNPKIYLINLATIEGMKDADLVLRPNDIIYVEPQERLIDYLREEVLPWLTFVFVASNFVTSFFIIRNVFN